MSSIYCATPVEMLSLWLYPSRLLLLKFPELTLSYTAQWTGRQILSRSLNIRIPQRKEWQSPIHTAVFHICWHTLPMIKQKRRILCFSACEDLLLWLYEDNQLALWLELEAIMGRNPTPLLILAVGLLSVTTTNDGKWGRVIWVFIILEVYSHNKSLAGSK